MRDFQTINCNIIEVQRLQDNLSNAIGPVLKNLLIDGNLIKNIILVSGVSNLVPHLLGRKPLICFVVRKNATADVWESTASATEKFVSLSCSANCTVSLWVA